MLALSHQHRGEPPPWANGSVSLVPLAFRRALPCRNSRIENISISALHPWKRNARTHSKKQIRQIAESIETFGFTNAVLIDAENTILAGHGRVEAAKLLGMDAVPCVRLEHMTPDQKRAYVLADNKLALNAGWDDEVLAQELSALLELDLDFSVEVTGFSIPEIDALVEGLAPEEPGDPADDLLPDPQRCRAAVSREISGSSGCTGWSVAMPSIRRSLRG